MLELPTFRTRQMEWKERDGDGHNFNFHNLRRLEDSKLRFFAVSTSWF